MSAAKSLPKVKCQLVGEDGNAFSIIGRFSRAARKAGWSQDDIAAVTEEAKSGDYDHLLGTILEHVDDDGE